MSDEPKDNDEFGPLDYVAHILYQYHCQSTGGSPVRWYALRDDMKKTFREQAIQTVASWATEEITQLKMIQSATSILGSPRKK